MSIAVKNEIESPTVDIKLYMAQLGQAARQAAEVLSYADPEIKNAALLNIASAIEMHRDKIRSENGLDMRAGKSAGLDKAKLDRLYLSEARIDAKIDGLKQIVSLDDPEGEISELAYRPSGIQVGKMRVPLGVIGIIFESRPNVTIDAAAL